MADQPDEDFERHLCPHAEACLHGGVALVATDTQLRIRFWNLAASRLLGGTPQARLGQPFISIVPKDRQDAVLKLTEQALHQGAIGEIEFHYQPTSGVPLDLAAAISPVVNDSGERIGVAVSIRDVTGRLEAARALAQAQKMAALGTMAGAMAHYFNNLLGGLVTTADFAQSQDDPEALRRALRGMATTLSRANKITLGLLAFAQGDYRDSPAVDVTATVRRFVDASRAPLAHQNIQLESDIQEVNLCLHQNHIQTILDNLTANACEAMPEGGTLRIELTPGADGRDVFLRISDSGLGIPEADLPHVFEPFFSTKTQETGGGEHTGLGLAIVHGMVKTLGGSVTLCSSRTDGTTCSVQIPRSVAHQYFKSPASHNET